MSSPDTAEPPVTLEEAFVLYRAAKIEHRLLGERFEVANGLVATHQEFTVAVMGALGVERLEDVLPKIDSLMGKGDRHVADE